MNELLQLLDALSDPKKGSATVIVHRVNNQLTVATAGIGQAITASLNTETVSPQSKNMVTALLVDVIFNNPQSDTKCP